MTLGEMSIGSATYMEEIIEDTDKIIKQEGIEMDKDTLNDTAQKVINTARSKLGVDLVDIGNNVEKYVGAPLIAMGTMIKMLDEKGAISKDEAYKILMGNEYYFTYYTRLFFIYMNSHPNQPPKELAKKFGRLTPGFYVDDKGIHLNESKIKEFVRITNDSPLNSLRWDTDLKPFHAGSQSASYYASP